MCRAQQVYGRRNVYFEGKARIVIASLGEGHSHMADPIHIVPEHCPVKGVSVPHVPDLDSEFAIEVGEPLAVVAPREHDNGFTETDEFTDGGGAKHSESTRDKCAHLMTLLSVG